VRFGHSDVFGGNDAELVLKVAADRPQPMSVAKEENEPETFLIDLLKTADLLEILWREPAIPAESEFAQDMQTARGLVRKARQMLLRVVDIIRPHLSER